MTTPRNLLDLPDELISMIVHEAVKMGKGQVCCMTPGVWEEDEVPISRRAYDHLIWPFHGKIKLLEIAKHELFEANTFLVRLGNLTLLDMDPGEAFHIDPSLQPHIRHLRIKMEITLSIHQRTTVLLARRVELLVEILQKLPALFPQLRTLTLEIVNFWDLRIGITGRRGKKLRGKRFLHTPEMEPEGVPELRGLLGKLFCAVQTYSSEYLTQKKVELLRRSGLDQQSWTLNWNLIPVRRRGDENQERAVKEHPETVEPVNEEWRKREIEVVVKEAMEQLHAVVHF